MMIIVFVVKQGLGIWKEIAIIVNNVATDQQFPKRGKCPQGGTLAGASKILLVKLIKKKYCYLVTVFV